MWTDILFSFWTKGVCWRVQHHTWWTRAGEEGKKSYNSSPAASEKCILLGNISLFEVWDLTHKTSSQKLLCTDFQCFILPFWASTNGSSHVVLQMFGCSHWNCVLTAPDGSFKQFLQLQDGSERSHAALTDSPQQQREGKGPQHRRSCDLQLCFGPIFELPFVL